MDFKRNRKLMNEAVNAGCKTMAELALYLNCNHNQLRESLYQLTQQSHVSTVN